MVILLDAIRTF